MRTALKNVWTEMVLPLIRRPKRVQVAALCWRPDGTGKEVLLITSRDTGRWILPKGWPIDGLNGAEAALQEAWEEAGVREAEIGSEAIGQYEYVKDMDSGGEVPVQTHVYLARVHALADDFPEAAERRREWVTPTRAAEMVAEPGLRAILRDLQ